MARNETYWFKHDFNARRDQKILTMRSVYGAEGYGWWWMLIEMMREAGDYRLKYTGKHTLNTMATELGTNPDKLMEFITDCYQEFDRLFDMDDNYFWSPSLLRRMRDYNVICDKRRDAINARWNRT